MKLQNKKGLIAGAKRTAKTAFINAVSLRIRKRLVVWVGRQSWISSQRKYWWAQELVKDLKGKSINEYHKFLWQNHLAYAETYNIDSRFGLEKMEGSRKLLFRDLAKTLLNLGIRRETDIRTVFDVGCSLGYLLRYMEEDFFPSAETLFGIDIDKQAVAKGSRYLKSKGSIIVLKSGDMESLHEELEGTRYDAIFCLGVLMYLKENAAREVVHRMLRHTRMFLIMSGLAHPGIDNKYLETSATRERDGTFIHNFDEMVESGGGKIVFRRWGGRKMIDNNSIYFVFANNADRLGNQRST